MLRHFRRHAELFGAVTILVMALTSCYSTIPVSAAPSRGAELILDMTPQATERMGGFLGRGTVSARGRLLNWEPDSVVVSMLATQIARGDEQLWRGERVAIPRDAVARITERQVNRGRTSLAILGAITLMATAVGIISGGISGTSGGGTKPAPQ
jgi:hypothetical protein